MLCIGKSPVKGYSLFDKYAYGTTTIFHSFIQTIQNFFDPLTLFIKFLFFYVLFFN